MGSRLITEEASTVPEGLDAAAVRRWAEACVRTLDEHRDAIDRINVFPVPDRDTGSNMLTTMRAAVDAVARITSEDATTADVWTALARGALAGAHGNSGVILSQVLRGLGEVLGPRPDALPPALARADELAAKAVTDPAPGTMLTVLHAAAMACARAAGADLPDVLRACAEAAAKALADTANQLPELARAGVVDAGGRGLVLVLDELAAEVGGEPRETTETVAAQRTPRDVDVLHTVREAGSTEYAYEVMYALEGLADAEAGRLRADLLRLGDCVSVVGDGRGSWAVHVHCNDVGAAIEAGIDVGRPHRIAVVRFDDQVAAATSRFAVERAIVALASGPGVGELFRAEGAHVLSLDGESRPEPADLVAVIAGCQASHVTVLPNVTGLDDVLADATAEAVRSGQDVIVVPTASPVQGLAALAVHDAARRPGEDVVAMAEAAAATRRGELVLAREQGITWVGVCQPGDVLGLLDGEIVVIEPGPAGEPSVVGAARKLVDRMLSGGGELVTALPGAGAPAGLADALAEHVRAEHREVEFTAYSGGQPDSLLLLGVE
ncbi:MAG TPA: DAK2 domain-containing protein [Pseudonocardiaceae bacterium]|nr:DAK2 domain-containing protein [Pseudonocardiaceae bacterium]